jgi:hypothetical protein
VIVPPGFPPLAAAGDAAALDVAAGEPAAPAWLTVLVEALVDVVLDVALAEVARDAVLDIVAAAAVGAAGALVGVGEAPQAVSNAAAARPQEPKTMERRVNRAGVRPSSWSMTVSLVCRQRVPSRYAVCHLC